MSKGNEPAYPVDRLLRSGLAKRELFAAMAMQGMLGRDGCQPAMASKDSHARFYSRVSDEAVNLADALLAALDRSA